VLSGTVCAVAVWLLWWCSVPAFSFRIITVGLLLIVLGAVWGIRMLIFLHARPDGMPRGRQAWVVPGVVVACLLLSVSGAGFQLRWALSRPAFDAAVRSGHPVEGRVGLYRIVNYRTVTGGIVFTEAGGSGLLDDAGFAWFPDGPGEGLGDTSWESPQLSPIGGGWYVWTATW
jgi:hypothetical protein